MLRTVSIQGTGIHTGTACGVRITPVRRGSGVTFVTARGRLPARVPNIDPLSVRATNLAMGPAEVRTVEHLMAALAFYEHDVDINVEGDEIPILDGSAAPWIRALESAGAAPNTRFFTVPLPLRIALDRSTAHIEPVPPNADPVYRVELEYSASCIGPAVFSFCPTRDDFCRVLGPARTFALESEVPQIRKAGLGVGGGLDSALILGPDGPLNPEGRRFADEPARHKLLDAIGDLYLLGGLPFANVTLFRPGHRLMHQVVRALMKTAS